MFLNEVLRLILIHTESTRTCQRLGHVPFLSPSLMERMLSVAVVVVVVVVGVLLVEVLLLQ
jgi:hypothetical protein